MKKITYYLKNFLSGLLKIIMAIMMGLASSFGKNTMQLEKRDNKTIEEKK
jgi:hypothetical protein